MKLLIINVKNYRRSLLKVNAAWVAYTRFATEKMESKKRLMRGFTENTPAESGEDGPPASTSGPGLHVINSLSH